MKPIGEIIQEFLKSESIAVAGVSSKPNQPANLIFKKLQKAGYEMYPVNPNLETFDGRRCYPQVSDIPETVSSVIICTPPNISPSIIADCIKARVKRVWMHRSFNQGSFSSDARKLAEENGLDVIPSGCPMMWVKPVDMFHWCFRKILQFQGKLPKSSTVSIES